MTSQKDAKSDKVVIPSVNCSWNDIVKHVTLVEDPIFCSPVDVDGFISVYKEILDTLDGSDAESKVSFFFEFSRVNSSQLCFRNDKTRSFFLEEAEERKLVPRLVEVCEGETAEEKLKRTQSESAIHKNMKKTKKSNVKPIKKIGSDTICNDKILLSAKAQFDKLTTQYNAEPENSAKKEKLKAKLQRISDMLNKK